MYRPDEKDIDRLSREAAEHYQAPGKPSWDALQQILDKELPQEKEKKRRGFFFFFLLLLGLSVAGTGIWYGTRHNNNKENNATAISGKDKAETKEATATDKKTAGSTNPSAQPKNSAATPATTTGAATTSVSKKNETLPAANSATITSNATTTPEEIAADSKSSTHKTTNPVTKAVNQNTIARKDKPGLTNVSANTLVNGDNKNKPSYKSTLHKQRGNEIAGGAGIASTSPPVKKKNKGNHTVIKNTASTEENGNDVTTADVVTNDTNTDNTKNDLAASGQKDNQPIAATVDTTADKTSAVKTAAVDSSIATVTKKDSAKAIAKKKIKSKNERAINIGLTAGLDLSTVKFTHGDNLGYNFGLMGGYQFSKHWSVYTGIIYTKKNYELNGGDYHPPKHYWTQYVDLQNVEGYCRMWEIPLLGRYTFNPGAKTAFFVSTGLSSYFMKKQDYNYSFKSNGVPGYSHWTNDSSFNHVFSILHLSAGFEKRLGKHMNWQIEPYAKIPLGGVGFGNIRLSSFGVNFSVQYRRPVKR